MSGATEAGGDDPYHPNAGWIAAGVIVAAVFAIGAVFWFMYHPL